MWRAVLLATVVCAMLVVGIINSHFTNPEYVRGRAQDYLQQFSGGRVTVGSAKFSWFGGIHLYDVTVAEASHEAQATTTPTPTGPTINVFECRETLLTHDLLSTLVGRLRIRSIVALEPTCVIARDAVDGTTNLEGLLPPVDSASSPEGYSLPTIELRDAGIQVVSRHQDHDRVVEDLKLTVRSRHPSPDSRFYDVVWHDKRGGKASGISQIDLNTGRIRNVRGGLPWMSLEAVLIAVNAKYDAAGTWSDLLGLHGAVRASDYNFGNGSAVDSPRSATIELNNASLSIPISGQEESLASKERYLRFERVFGAIEVTAGGIRADFDASFHGPNCSAGVPMRGGLARVMTLDDVDFEITLSMSGLNLPRTGPDAPPDQVRFVKRWDRLAKFFRGYDPHGPVDLEISARRRAGVDEQLEVDSLVVTARGGDASCRFFPYRVRNLSGTVELTPAGVYLRLLRGEHDGGLVTVDGELSAPNRRAAAELKITGVRIPIDRALYNAVSERYRRIHDQFEPNGKLDVELSLSRPRSTGEEPAPWRSRCALSLDDVSASYVGFPYQVEHLSGLLMVEDRRLEVIGVEGSSGESLIGVDGIVTMTGEASPTFELAIWGKGVTLDDKLFASLPEKMHRRLSRFQPSGRFDVKTTLTSDTAVQTVQHESDIRLSGVTVVHEDFPVPIEEIQGSLRITTDGIAVSDVSGVYQGAEISVGGYVAGGITGRADAPSRQTTELAVRCRNLSLDDTLRASAPIKLRKVLSDWRVDTPIDLDITWRHDPASDRRDPIYRAAARLEGAGVRHPKFPLPLEDVYAEIVFDGSSARASGIKAQYGQAAVRADFDERKTETGEEGTIRVIARGMALDESIRDLLPPRLRSGWDKASVTGHADLRLDSLHYERPRPGEPRVWRVDGQIELHEAVLPGIVNIQHVSGTVTGAGYLLDRLGGVSLSGTLELETVDVLGQHLTDVGTEWSYAHAAGDHGGFVLDSVQGNIYGGSIKGDVGLLYDKTQAQYNLSATVHDMDIQPFIRAARSPQLADSEPVDTRGFADARLYLSGPINDRPKGRSHTGQVEGRARRGGGRVEIRKGHLYRLPIMLAILNVINLAVPDENASHNAQADFHVVGNRVELADISLGGAILNLVGEGSMSLPDRGMDLHLVNVPPWLARVPGLDAFVEAASRGLVELHVTGPLFRPTVRAVPLRATMAELKSLFQKKKPKKITAAEP
jgi:hypothetical protein